MPRVTDSLVVPELIVMTCFSGKTSDKDSNVTCRKCGKTYASPVNLKRHLQIHKEPLKCHCGASFGTKEALKEHENAKHKSLYVCKECPVWRQFWSRSGLFAHRLANHKTSSRLKVRMFLLLNP